MTQQDSYTIVLLEDNETDVFLLRRRLQQLVPNLTLEVAGTQADYERLVRTLSLDAIISDYRLPQYSGIEALMFARKHAPVVPFIFVTGALHNEELAADTILKGASGFVLKNNLDKLDRIIPPLLEGQRPEPQSAPVTAAPVAAAPVTAAAEPAVAVGAAAGFGENLSEVVGQLSDADPETLAAIRALLAARRS